MNIEEFKKDLSLFFKNKFLLLSSIILTVIMFLLIIALIVNIHQSDIRLVVRYSSFGITHFYREQWTYFLNFIFFTIIIYVTHLIIAIKVYKKYNKPFVSCILMVLAVFLYAIVWSTFMRIIALI